VADEQPGAAENALHLEFEQLGIGVDATMHATGLDQPGDLVSVAHAMFSKCPESASPALRGARLPAARRELRSASVRFQG